MLRLAVLAWLVMGTVAYADVSAPADTKGIAAEAFPVQRMQGPYPSLEAVCAALRGEAVAFACASTPAAQLAHPPSPFRDVRVLRARELLGDPDNPKAVDTAADSYDLHLAVQLDAGWFVAREIAVLDDLWNHGGGRHRSVRIEPTVLGRGHAPALLVRVRSLQAHKWTEAELERLVVAGVGPSGVPAWVGPVLLSERGSGERKEGPEFTIDRSFSWRLASDGALVLARGRGDRNWVHLEPTAVRATVGRHPIVFP